MSVSLMFLLRAWSRVYNEIVQSSQELGVVDQLSIGSVLVFIFHQLDGRHERLVVCQSFLLESSDSLFVFNLLLP